MEEACCAPCLSILGLDGQRLLRPLQGLLGPTHLGEEKREIAECGEVLWHHAPSGLEMIEGSIAIATDPGGARHRSPDAD
jgi:hypothetical protein